MKRLKSKCGFTLIEIIVVLIIVGVLAAIALPNLFNNIQRSKAGEGIAALGADKSMTEGCVMGHNGNEGPSCSTLTFASTANFSYQFGTKPAGTTSSGGNYTIIAYGNTLGNNLVLTKNTATGALSCSGLSAYVGVC